MALLDKSDTKDINGTDRRTNVGTPANADMIEGFRDGYDLTAPEPSANRSTSYRHGFMCGRADKTCKRIDSYENLVRRAEEAMAIDSQV